MVLPLFKGMKKMSEEKVTKYFILGDIHGSANPIWNFHRNVKEELCGDDWLILVGDSGLNYYGNKRDIPVKGELSMLPFKYFVIRGNHDRRPSSVKTMEEVDIFGGKGYVEEKYPNIYYAKDDVNLYNIAGYKTVVIPGAYSVDKYYRLLNHYHWFKDEQLSEEEKNKGLDILNSIDWKCDVVLSHTCPKIYMPTDLFLPFIDQSTVDNSMEEYLGGIEFKLQYKLWVWGHYHHYRVYPLEDGKQKLMLFNDKAIELQEWMSGSLKSYNCFKG